MRWIGPHGQCGSDCVQASDRHASDPQLSFGRPTVQTYHHSRSSAYTLSIAVQFFSILFQEAELKKALHLMFKNSKTKMLKYHYLLRALCCNS